MIKGLIVSNCVEESYSFWRIKMQLVIWIILNVRTMQERLLKKKQTKKTVLQKQTEQAE